MADPADDPDEALDDTSQGANLNSDDDDSTGSEIDEMGDAAGLHEADGKPLKGIEQVERRDERRSELDPHSPDHATD